MVTYSWVTWERVKGLRRDAHLADIARGLGAATAELIKQEGEDAGVSVDRPETTLYVAARGMPTSPRPQRVTYETEEDFKDILEASRTLRIEGMPLPDDFHLGAAGYGNRQKAPKREPSLDNGEPFLDVSVTKGYHPGRPLSAKIAIRKTDTDDDWRDEFIKNPRPRLGPLDDVLKAYEE